MRIKVIHTTPLLSEYLVDLNGDLILPCYDFEPDLPVQVTWRRNDITVPPSMVLQNGSLHITKYVFP